MSPRIRFDIVLNNLVAWAVTTGLIYLKSDGSPWRPIVHIEDISRAFIAALRLPRSTFSIEAFNVGCTEHNYRIRDIAEIVAEVVPAAHRDWRKMPGRTNDPIASASKRSLAFFRPLNRNGMHGAEPRNFMRPIAGR